MIPEKVIYIADPVIQSVPLKENGEALVNVYDYVVSRKARVRTTEGQMLREGVVDKLIAAQQFLPAGYSLFVVEGWRDPVEQGRRWQVYRDELRERHDDWLEEEIDAEASKLYSPPGSVMPHATGAAFDITLLDANEKVVDMGTKINAGADETENKTYSLSEDISKEQLANRKILFDALNSVGFINYPTEWWHWSIGDQYWAHVENQPFAVYGELENYEKEEMV